MQSSRNAFKVRITLKFRLTPIVSPKFNCNGHYSVENWFLQGHPEPTLVFSSRVWIITLKNSGTSSLGNAVRPLNKCLCMPIILAQWPNSVFCSVLRFFFFVYPFLRKHVAINPNLPYAWMSWMGYRRINRNWLPYEKQLTPLAQVKFRTEKRHPDTQDNKCDCCSSKCSASNTIKHPKSSKCILLGTSEIVTHVSVMWSTAWNR